MAVCVCVSFVFLGLCRLGSRSRLEDVLYHFGPSPLRLEVQNRLFSASFGLLPCAFGDTFFLPKTWGVFGKENCPHKGTFWANVWLLLAAFRA